MKIFLPILLFLISSSSQSFFGFGEGSVKDVNKCIKENNSGLIKDSVVKQKCIEKYETERKNFRLADFLKPASKFVYIDKYDNEQLYLSRIEGKNVSDRVITGITYVVYFFDDNGKIVDRFLGNKVEVFIEPGPFKKYPSANILKNKKFTAINEECKAVSEITDSEINCYIAHIESIHTLDIDI